MSELPIDAVHAVLARAGIAATAEPEPAGAGRRNDVWFVATDEGELVVRLLADDRRLATERRVLELADAAGVPVARCGWSQHGPFPAMVQARLPGRRLDEVDATPSLLHELAELLRRVHAIPVAGGWGNLDGELRGASDDLPVWFTERARAEVTAAPLSVEDADAAAGALSVMDEAAPLLRRQTPGLVHGDVQPSNVLVADGRVTGLLDWEAAKAGPPAFDFGWWDWWSTAFSTPWSTEALIDAYDPDARLDRAELAELRRLVQLRIWVRELAAGGTSGDVERMAAARSGLAFLI